MLNPRVVEALQELLTGFPDWEIVYTVALIDHLDDWPDMGLFIRADEILDTLQRQYLPMEYRNLKYPGSRRGTEAEAAARWKET